ncbi:Dymeclin-like protein [Drosera capensis]
MGGAVPSTPRNGGESRPKETAEYLVGTFIGRKSFPLSSDFCSEQLLHQAPGKDFHSSCLLLARVYCIFWRSIIRSLQSSECSLYIFDFFKYIIENAKPDNFEELQLSLDENEAVPSGFSKGLSVESFLMQSVLSFIGNVDVSSVTYLLHCELLNLMIVAMSTQLRSSSGVKEVHPFIETTMIQEPSLAVSVVHRLLLNYIARPSSSFDAASYSVFSDGTSTGVLQRVSSAAGIAIYSLPHVLDFFNSRMDAQKIVDEWSVEKVLEVIITNCRSWRGDGMKMFMQSRFTYEQESHPEEFFIPHVWQLVLSNRFTFDSSKINLFSVGPPKELSIRCLS